MKNLVIADDFYATPLKVRGFALTRDYDDVKTLNYPGLQSKHSFVASGIGDVFAAMTGEYALPDEKNSTFGRFRVMLAGGETALKIHADGASGWSGLIYLNLPGQCWGGTAFYRHKDTGLTGPPTDEEARWFGIDTGRELERQILKRDSLDPSAWTVDMFVSMRFNRLLLFRGSRLFHSHTTAWGECIQTGRLTQNFFFDTTPTKQLEG